LDPHWTQVHLDLACLSLPLTHNERNLRRSGEAKEKEKQSSFEIKAGKENPEKHKKKPEKVEERELIFKEPTEIITENLIKEYDEDKGEINRGSILLKIILNYFSLVSIVSSFNFHWPNEMKQNFSVQNKVSNCFSEIFSFDCLMNKAPVVTEASIQPYFFKLLIIVISPFILLAVEACV